MAYNTAILMTAMGEAQKAMPAEGKGMVFPVIDFGAVALLSRASVVE